MDDFHKDLNRDLLRECEPDILYLPPREVFDRAMSAGYSFSEAAAAEQSVISFWGSVDTLSGKYD